MKKISIFLLVLTLTLSCKKETKNLNLSKEKNLSISLDFPDTVYVNKGYDGKINYKNDLDTITKVLNQLNPLRTVVYTFLKTDNVNYSNKDLKKIVTDTFYTDSNRVIPIYGEFNNTGTYYIDGIVKDEVIIENGGKNSKGEWMDRIITNEFRVTKKVIVIKKNDGVDK
ncbi:hypothetical protein D3C87_1089360 [compost metagenome]